MTKGWIKYHRSSFENKLYFSEPFTRWQAWMDLVLLANHKEGIIRKRGVKLIVERGQIGHSEVTLAKRWGWSRGKIRRFLDELKMEHQIVQQKTNVTTLITVVNYSQYQNDETDIVQQTDSKRYTNKNEKNNTLVLVKQNDKKNEKEINGDFSSGEHLLANKYGNKFPKIDY